MTDIKNQKDEEFREKINKDIKRMYLKYSTGTYLYMQNNISHFVDINAYDDIEIKFTSKELDLKDFMDIFKLIHEGGDKGDFVFFPSSKTHKDIPNKELVIRIGELGSNISKEIYKMLEAFKVKGLVEKYNKEGQENKLRNQSQNNQTTN